MPTSLGPHCKSSRAAVASGYVYRMWLQRFGSRDALLDAIGLAFVGQVSAAFALRRDSQIDRIGAALAHIDIVRHLTFLAARPAARSEYSLELRKQIGYCLAEAIETLELPPCDVAALTRRIQLAYLGLAAAALLEARTLSEADLTSALAELL
jgi:hypothetical protein